MFQKMEISWSLNNSPSLDEGTVFLQYLPYVYPSILCAVTICMYSEKLKTIYFNGISK